MAIKHVVVRDLLDTRFVLLRHATGKTEIRYTQVGTSAPLDRMLAINPDLDRDVSIASPEFTTYAGIQDYLASLTSPAAA
jgi:hypothetical protein